METYSSSIHLNLQSDKEICILQHLCATKGTQGFIHCLFKAASLATLKKQMKVSKIIPLYKSSSGDKNNFSNYRPISMFAQLYI